MGFLKLMKGILSKLKDLAQAFVAREYPNSLIDNLASQGLPVFVISYLFGERVYRVYLTLLVVMLFDGIVMSGLWLWVRLTLGWNHLDPWWYIGNCCPPKLRAARDLLYTTLRIFWVAMGIFIPISFRHHLVCMNAGIYDPAIIPLLNRVHKALIILLLIATFLAIRYLIQEFNLRIRIAEARTKRQGRNEPPEPRSKRPKNDRRPPGSDTGPPDLFGPFGGGSRRPVGKR